MEKAKKPLAALALILAVSFAIWSGIVFAKLLLLIPSCSSFLCPSPSLGYAAILVFFIGVFLFTLAMSIFFPLKKKSDNSI